VSRDDLHRQLTEYLVTLFEISSERVSLDARLVDDLDLDSIDIVDLLVKLREVTGQSRRMSSRLFEPSATCSTVSKA
jgi:acyl carrier protein